FSHWIGGTSTGLLAAIAPVCGTTGWQDRQTGLLVMAPPPLEPMAEMLVRGGVDPKRPFDGSATCFPAQVDTDYWVNADSCMGAPIYTTNNVNIARWQYHACVDTTEVILVTSPTCRTNGPTAGPTTSMQTSRSLTS